LFLYGFVDLCFVALINRYRKEALRVQYFVLVVLLLATGESFSWFVTYKFLNESGQSVCCPYPSLIILSTVIKIMAGMIARVMTTLICLGYGTVRPRITWPEVLVVSGLGLCYFISVGALEINHIITKSHGHMKPPVVWEFLVVVTNICFGGWIFTSLAMTCKNLETYGQVAKLKMYTSLKKVLIAYVLLSFLLMATEGAVYSGVILLDWKWIWTIWAANRLLMFAILLFVAFMWRPRGTSLLYSQMEQIPSEEVPPTPCSTDVGSHEMGIEMVRRIPMPLPPPSAHDERGAASPVSKRNISLLSHPETSSL
jgi:hypothetical protein